MPREPLTIQASAADYDHVTSLQAEELRVTSIKLAAMQRLLQEYSTEHQRLTQMLDKATKELTEKDLTIAELQGRIAVLSGEP